MTLCCGCVLLKCQSVRSNNRHVPFIVLALVPKHVSFPKARPPEERATHQTQVSEMNDTRLFFLVVQQSFGFAFGRLDGHFHGFQGYHADGLGPLFACLVNFFGRQVNVVFRNALAAVQ